MIDHPLLKWEIATHPSPDSDYDIRGPTSCQRRRRSAFSLLLKRNGYVLEQLYSPLVIAALPQHEELKRIARNCITRHHVHHYLGFADTQWRLFEKESPPRI